MEFSDIKTTFIVLAALCAAIVLVSDAVRGIGGLLKVANKPNDRQNERLDKLEDVLDHHSECLDNDRRQLNSVDRRLEDIEEQNKLLMHGMMQMMTHLADGGDHVDKLIEIRNKFETFLIEK